MSVNSGPGAPLRRRLRPYVLSVLVALGATTFQWGCSGTPLTGGREEPVQQARAGDPAGAAASNEAPSASPSVGSGTAPDAGQAQGDSGAGAPKLLFLPYEGPKLRRDRPVSMDNVHLRTSTVAVNDEVLDPHALDDRLRKVAALAVDLPGLGVTEFTMTRVEPAFNGGTTWIGTAEGAPQPLMVLAARGELIVGTVEVGGRTFAVETLEPGLAWSVSEMNPSWACGVSALPDPAPVDSATTARDGRIAPANHQPDGNDVLDVLVIYTRRVRQAASGGTVAQQQAAVELITQQMVTNANARLANSGNAQRLRVVGCQEDTYQETSPRTATDDVSQDLDRLTNPTDGNMDAARTTDRDRVGADVVVLLVEDSFVNANNVQTNGVAWVQLTNNTATFNARNDMGPFEVVIRPAMFGSTFVHEFGHNLGGQHPRNGEDRPSPARIANTISPDAFGYIDTANLFKTTMASGIDLDGVDNDPSDGWPDFGRGQETRTFSNPNRTFTNTAGQTAATGVANAEDMARFITQQFGTMAQYRLTTVPLQPETISCATQSDSSVQVTWVDPVPLNGHNETGYLVERVQGTFPTVGSQPNLPTPVPPITDAATTSADATSHLDGSLQEGTRYSYRVRALNNALESSPSLAASAVTLSKAATGLSAVSLSASTNRITFTDNSTTEAFIELYRKPFGAPDSSYTYITFRNGDPSSGTPESLDDPVASESTRYTYRIATSNSAGNVNYSAEVSVLTRPAAPSGLTLQLTPGVAERVTLTWNDNSGLPSPKEQEQGFRVERGDALEGPFSPVASAALGANATATASSTDQTVEESTRYFYRVVAFNESGDSGPSAVAEVLTLPAPPSAVTATPIDAGTVSLTWADNSGQPSPPKTQESGFRIERSLSPAFATFDVVASAAGSTNATSSQDTSVEESTEYHYRVIAFNASGDSAASNVDSALTMPAAPSGLRVVFAGFDSVELAWTDNSGDPSPPKTQELRFRIEREETASVRTGDNHRFDAALTVGTNSTSGTDRGMPVDITVPRTFRYRVFAVNASGDSLASNVVVATLLAVPEGPGGGSPGSQVAAGPGGGGSGKSGCFIATAAYGSYMEPQVMVLRRFRDEHLVTNAPGRRFVEFYYRHSPAIANVIVESELLRMTTRVALSPIVYAVAYPDKAGSALLLLVFLASRYRRRQRADLP